MRVLLLLCMSLFFVAAYAQEYQEDIDRLTINPYIPPYEQG